MALPVGAAPANSRGRRLYALAGLVFVLVWAGAMVAFPVVKDQPLGYAPIACGIALGIWTMQAGPRAWLRDAITSMSARQFLLRVLVVALTLRLAAILVFPRDPAVDDEQFQRYAVNMLHGAGYGAPGYRAWFPPGMSFALLAVYWLTTPSPYAGKMFQVALGGLLVWQTWALTREIVPDSAARMATLLVAVLPTFVFYTSTLGYEILLGLIFVLVWRLVLADRRDVRPLTSAVILAALGAILGFGTLVKPICLLVPPLLGVAWWSMGLGIGRAATRVAVVVLVMALVVAPWTIRNYRVLGAFVPVSTNGGYTLYAANNPDATGLAMPMPPVPGELGEVSRDHLRMRAALTWIVTHPIRWAELATAKVAYTWGTTSSVMAVVSADRLPTRVEDACKALLNVTWGLLFVWCAVATFRQHAWARAGLVPGLLLLAYVFALHLFYEAHSRHHVPVLTVLCVIAGLAWAGPSTGESLSATSLRSR